MDNDMGNGHAWPTAAALTATYEGLATADLLWVLDVTDSLGERVYVSEILTERIGVEFSVQIRPVVES